MTTREEIDNLFVDFDEMGFYPTALCKDAEEYAIEWRNNMRKAISNHETDTLREFVEWLKERLKEQYTRFYNGEGSDIVRSIGVHIVMSNLDTYLEKFLGIENELAKK